MPRQLESNSKQTMPLRRLTVLAAALTLTACSIAEQQAVNSTPNAARQQTGLQTGIVSAADPRATEAGMAILRQGGSATDAAIAVMLTLSVVEPQSSGIGGGGFFVRGGRDGEIATLDGRETAPSGADGKWFLDAEGNPLGYREAVIGGLSVGVPGNLALAEVAHARYGKLEWQALFKPAIALARDGFVITERFRRFLTFAKNRAAHTEEGRALFYGADGEPLPVGTLVRNPAMAQTLEKLAAEGPSWFYDGAAGAELAATVSAATPGRQGMAAQDVADYRAKWREPVCGTYRQHRICGMGPPSSGATTVFAILKQIERFDMAALGPQSATAWHLFAESQRLAYADRELYLADSDFVSVPVAGLMEDSYLSGRSRFIMADKAMRDPPAGKPTGVELGQADGDEPPEHGTSHFVAMDSDGNVVTYTSTVEGPFGSGLMYGGFYLNNELTDFSFVPEKDGKPVANRVEGGKRPRSSMSPTLVYGPDGNLRVAIGAAGGGTIPVQVAKTLIAVIDWDLPVAQAIALPNLYAPRDTLTLEEAEPLLSHRAALEALGHSTGSRDEFGKANALEYRAGQWLGAADPRSEGNASVE